LKLLELHAALRVAPSPRLQAKRSYDYLNPDKLSAKGAASPEAKGAKGGAGDVAEAKGAKASGGGTGEGGGGGAKAAAKFDDDVWSKETDYCD